MSPQYGIETSIRQLIVNGKSKAALDQAKEFYKKIRDAASEALLIDAYIARIAALSAQNLTLEAKSLKALLLERFPAAKDRVNDAPPGDGDPDELLRPLADPGLNADRRAAIEKIIQNRVTDLAALSMCPALPPEHALRRAAAAVDRAFNLVTSGPVTDEQIVLAEVSHRSPLAPWKFAIRAIACFYRGDDRACEECLAAIRPESAAARLVRTIRAAIPATGAPLPDNLNAAEKALLSRIEATDSLRAALSNLDRSFARDRPAKIFKAIQAAVKECRRQAPDLLPQLRRKVAIRCEVAELDSGRANAALDGAPRRDAAFFKESALTFERTHDSEDLMESIAYWDRFRVEAVREGWFAAEGMEAAALYLHMAQLHGRMPRGFLRELRRPYEKSGSREAIYFCFPDDIYRRACRIDPHRGAFMQWLQWAKTESTASAEKAAQAWSIALPADVEPLLFLMESAERRKAFPTAISYLDRAERIDGVNPAVRTARLRLLAAAALGHLQKKKPHLAAEKMAAFAELPQAQQGGQRAFLEVMAYLIFLSGGDRTQADRARTEAAEALEDSVAAELLIFGYAVMAKLHAGIKIARPDELTEQQRSGIPLSLARTIRIAWDIGFEKFQVPVAYLRETEARFAGAASSLDIEQIRALGDMGIVTRHFRLAWDASSAGLERGGPMESRFLLMRAEALAEGGFGERREVLIAAAAALARIHGDSDAIGKAVQTARNPFDGDPLSLTADQAAEVVRREKASASFPARYDRGPDYSDLLPQDLCMCPSCRRQRGESGDSDFGDPDSMDENPFDEEAMKTSFYNAAPKEMPRELLPALFEAAKAAYFSDEDPEEVLSRILMGGGGGRKTKKKGRR